MTGETLILGVGNILLGDDGAGVHIVNELAENWKDIPASVDIEDGGTAGFDLISLMKGRRKIIIIDSLKSAGQTGSIFRLTRSELVYSGSSFSTHDLGILHAIDALEVLGETPVVEFIGIVPESMNEIKLELSEKVKLAVPSVIELVKSGIMSEVSV